MKKQITIELSGSWVLTHRGDEELPISVLKSELLNTESVEVKDSSLTALVLEFDDSKIKENAIKSQVASVFAQKYPDENVEEILSIEFAEIEAEEKTPAGKSEEGKSEGESKEGLTDAVSRLRTALEMSGIGLDGEKESGASGDVKEILSQIDHLVGATEFRKLADEIIRIAPEIIEKKSYGVFLNQSYLFSIGDGCGLTTYLQLFARLISALGLKKMHAKAVIEERLEQYKESMEPFENALRVLHSNDGDKGRVICIDISEWLNKTDTHYFKQFLRVVEKVSADSVIVFRVPFVDKDVLSTIKHSLNDLLTVRSVTFPPFGREEIETCAQRELEGYGYNVTKTAWEFFHERITEEKSDGKFYGLNTVKKVVKELVYNKMLDNTKRKKNSDTITRSDTRALCFNLSDEYLSGTEQLNRLVGNEQIKKRIEEIIAQIELSIRENSSDRPCIHMRFEGNPGTGKTTVARIIGKILKERGVLRIGNFYEYAGRDFCGRYIGETAPKTASICRDAYGSVLFIDEAYSLYRGDGNDRDYGREAIDTLIAEMENHRSDLVVIMAGYTDDMEKLMQGNHGLASRMPYTIEFPNFTREQLYEIYVSMVKAQFKHDKEIFEAAHEYFMAISDDVLNSKEFSNARFVRNLFERTWAKAAMRCQLNKKVDIVLTKEDFDRACCEKDFAFNTPKKTRLGF